MSFYPLRTCTTRLPLNHYFEEGDLNICKYIESRIDNCTESHSRCFTEEEMIQLKMDMIESFLSTIEVNCLKLISSQRSISQKIWNVTRWSVFQEIRDCPTYKKNTREPIKTIMRQHAHKPCISTACGPVGVLDTA